MFRADLLLTIRRYYSVYEYSNWYMSFIYVDWLLAGYVPIGTGWFTMTLGAVVCDGSRRRLRVLS